MHFYTPISWGGQDDFVRFLASFSPVPASQAKLFHFSYLVEINLNGQETWNTKQRQFLQ